MKIRLRNPSRVEVVAGPKSVAALLGQLALNPQAHLVIRNGTLVPIDAWLADSDEVEIRPVLSGGAA